jgi:hypothetical protein
VSSIENVVSDHTPTDMGLPGLTTRSICRKRRGSPRSATSTTRSAPSTSNVTASACGTTARIAVGASHQPATVTTKRPAARLFRNTSHPINPRQPGQRAGSRPE